MKRLGNLYQQICSVENLKLADAIARKGKKHHYGIKVFDRNRDLNLQALNSMLLDKTYKTSAYTTFKIYEPKERLVFRLPYFPDRIVHHAVMNLVENIFVSTFTSDTYSCIKGRGIHAADKAIKKALRNETETRFCLKIDIKKFYPSVDHAILKKLLRRKIKDPDLLWLMDEIIDSAEGLPIGNYLSQYFANFYLTYFDHWIKEILRVKHYFRYADDIVVFSGSKEYLHTLLKQISHYLTSELNLQVKGNYQVFPINKNRGVDFLGYVYYHGYTKLRKSIKQNFCRMLARRPNRKSIASYYGWACHANTKTLLKTLLDERVQKLQHRRVPKRVHWRQNKNRTYPESGNSGS